jgi:hypothetical protein
LTPLRHVFERVDVSWSPDEVFAKLQQTIVTI